MKQLYISPYLLFTVKVLNSYNFMLNNFSFFYFIFISFNLIQYYVNGEKRELSLYKNVCRTYKYRRHNTMQYENITNKQKKKQENLTKICCWKKKRK